MRDLFSRLRGSVRQVLARLQRGGIKHPLKASHVSYAAPRGAVQAEQPPEVVSPEAKGQQLQQDLDRAHAARLASSELLAELQGGRPDIPSAGVGPSLGRAYRARTQPPFLAALRAASGGPGFDHRLCHTSWTSWLVRLYLSRPAMAGHCLPNACPKPRMMGDGLHHIPGGAGGKV